MSAGAPAYESRMNASGLGQLRVQDTADTFQATGQALNALGQATGRLGNQIGEFALQQQKINTASTVSDRKSQFYKDLDAIDKEHQNDPDMVTMPDRYKTKTEEARSRALAGLPPAEQAMLGDDFTRMSLSYNQGARTTALRKQSDGFQANTDQEYERLSREYTGATTDEQRNAVVGQLDSTLNTGVSRGMITQKAAEAYRQGLKTTGDNAIVYRDVARDPIGTLKRLDDPAYAPGVPVMAREQLRVQAKQAADEQKAQGLFKKELWNPGSTTFDTGRVITPENAAPAFRSIIGQESGFNPNAQSPQGAAGLTQLMPGTAREMANKSNNPAVRGMFDGESDASIQNILKKNETLAYDLGLAYFQQNLRQFNGKLAPAIAAYHAGTYSKPVMEAHQRALTKYGENYSAAQFSAELPDWLADGKKNGDLTPQSKKTKDYVLDVFKRMGADPGGTGVSAAMSARIDSGLQTIQAQEQARQNQITNQLVYSGGQIADALSPILNQAGQVDPQLLASARAMLSIGVSRGDARAAEKLRGLDQAITDRVMVQQAWQTRPEMREAEISAARARISTGQVIQPEDMQRLKIYEAVHSEAASLRNSNAIGLFERQGGADASLLNAQAPINSPETRQAFAQRQAISDRAHQVNGGERMVFKPEEKTAWKNRWSEMGDTDKADMIKLLSDTSSSEDSYRTALKELTGGDQLAATAGRFMRSKPELAKDIIRGTALLEHPAVKPKADDIRNALARELGGAIYPPKVQEDLINASLAVYAAERGKNGALYNPSDGAAMEAALEKVIGKTVKRNGVRVPLPDGVPERAFGDAMDNLSAAALEPFGGARGRDGKPLDPSYVGRHAKLTPMGVGDGRYLVTMPAGKEDATVMTKFAQPLVIDLNEVVRIQRTNTGATMTGRANRRLADEFRAQREELGIDNRAGGGQ